MKLWLQVVVVGVLWWSLTARELLQETGEGPDGLSEGEVLEGSKDKDDDENTPPWWIFLIIPIISGIVGFVTNVVAIKMCFYPLEFWGWKLWQPENSPFGLFGWQGIVPTKAKKTVGKLLDLFLARLIDVSEIFGQVDPHEVALHTSETRKDVTRYSSGELMKMLMPAVWASLPVYVRDEIAATVEKESEGFIPRMMAEIRSNILDIVDLKGFATRKADENKQAVVDMFLRIGKSEIAFIEWCGFYFGVPFGILQAVVYYFYRGAWVLPVAGSLVGYFTNLIAMKAIFEPASPIKIGRISIQGIFVKRQWDAAVEIADVGQREFFSAKHVMEEMLTGSRKEAFRTLVQRVASDFIDDVYSAIEMMGFTLALGEDAPQRMRNTIVDAVIEHMPSILPAAYEYMDEKMDIKNILTQRLRELDPPSFVGILRPAFQEDELKLIAVGGVLGGIVGVIQQFAIFHWFE